MKTPAQKKAAVFRKAARLLEDRKAKGCCEALARAVPFHESYDDYFATLQGLMGRPAGEFWWPTARDIPFPAPRNSEHLTVTPRITALELVALVLEDSP